MDELVNHDIASVKAVLDAGARMIPSENNGAALMGYAYDRASSPFVGDPMLVDAFGRIDKGAGVDEDGSDALVILMFDV